MTSSDAKVADEAEADLAAAAAAAAASAVSPPSPSSSSSSAVAQAVPTTPQLGDAGASSPSADPVPSSSSPSSTSSPSAAKDEGADDASVGGGEGSDGPKVEKDEQWIGMHGPSTYQKSALGGLWDIFKNEESGMQYYVNTQTNWHTWECPPEVAEELKKLALEGALDAYGYEGLGADFETNGPWIPPSPEKAAKYKAASVFGGGRAPCCCFRDDDFAQLGVGVALYFRTLKSLACVFLLLTVLSFPAWAFYAYGSRMTGSLPDPLKASRVSLGNVGFFLRCREEDP
jgi:hypothetical protein